MVLDGGDEMSDEAAAPPDDHSWRTELRSLVSGVDLIVLSLAIVAGVWGVLVTLADASGDGIGGNLAVIAPGLYAGWCMLEMAWKRAPSIGHVLMRMLTACFVAPVFVAIPIGIVQAIAVAFPAVRQTIAESGAQNGGFHYWWSEGVVAQLFLVPMAGYVIGMCIPLGVVLIIVMPVLSIRAPRIAAAGSHLERVDGRAGPSATAFVFVGLGATTLGIVLWVFGDGGSILEFPDGVARSLDALSYGDVSLEVFWPLGVVLVVAGVLSMICGCIPVLIARGRAADA
ncbi:hypothetical protein M2317_001415 [Microbacterium sp. ZKA21]|uniref:hypothetical protein n=1 Tax=Microbacterium sp. ZKA21 TaxID=3381694 RepID=UPI003D217AA4